MFFRLYASSLVSSFWFFFPFRPLHHSITTHHPPSRRESTNSPIETNRNPRRVPSSRICGNAATLRLASRIPSCKITIVPGARFFSINHRMYATGGRIGSCGYAHPSTQVYPRSLASFSCHGHATPPGARKNRNALWVVVGADFRVGPFGVRRLDAAVTA